MPFLTINSNAKLAQEQIDNLVVEGAELVASELHKPISYVIVDYRYNPNMSFGGKKENIGVLAEMKSIGFGNKAGLAKILTEFLYDRLKADLHNINIEFVDMPASTVAIGGNLLG